MPTCEKVRSIAERNPLRLVPTNMHDYADNVYQLTAIYIRGDC